MTSIWEFGARVGSDCPRRVSRGRSVKRANGRDSPPVPLSRADKDIELKDF